MELKLGILLALLLLLALLFIVMLAGCTATEGDSGNSAVQPQTGPQQPRQQAGNFGYGNRTGRFGNLTAEQRQQMFEQRMRMAAAACQNLSEGDSCLLPAQRGNTSGTCNTYNGTLICRGNFTGGGNYSGYGQPQN